MTWDLDAHAKRGHWPDPGGDPTQPNDALEKAAQASGGQVALTPPVAKIQRSSGLLNMIRNRANEAAADPEQQPG